MSTGRLIVCYLTIALCVSCFWSGIAFLAHIRLGLSVMAIPTTFTVVMCISLFCLGLCGAAARNEFNG